MQKKLSICLLTAFITSAAASDNCGSHRKITQQEMLAAQKAWGDGIVHIGAARDHKKAALAHIAALYGYDQGPVLFKPTKARVVQFRDDVDEALSYFVGGKEPEDKGFALAPFTKVRFVNHAITMDCDSALAQGNYYFTTADAKEIKVEYTFGYVRDKNGRLKINLQHSSVPYSE